MEERAGWMMEEKKTGKLNLIMGARNGANNSREANDFYATHPSASRAFLNKLNEDGVILNKNIVEPACGQGHMAEVFKEYGYNVEAFDLIDRGYGKVQDFFLYNEKKEHTDYITNPPFKVACDFARHALTLLGGDRL